MSSSGLPTDLAAGHLVDALRALNRKPNDHLLAEVDPKLVDSVERRLLAALRRDRAGSVLPDGYPTATGGAGRGGTRTITVEDEDGHPDRVPVTGVEAAAIALAENEVIKDRHHQLTLRAAHALEAAVVALNTLVAALASVDDLTKTTGPAARTCAHCTDKRGQGANRPVHATGTVGDRLERAVALCKACYGYVEQTAKPGTHAGHLPTDEQIRDHEERGRWKVHVAAPAQAAPAGGPEEASDG